MGRKGTQRPAQCQHEGVFWWPARVLPGRSVLGIDSRPPLLAEVLRLEASVWSRCLRMLEGELPEQQFNTWVRPLQAVESGGALKLLAPNRFAVDWVRAQLLPRLTGLLAELGITTSSISVEVGARPAVSQSAPILNGTSALLRASKASAQPKAVGVPLNAEFTFDRFVEGKSNNLAKAAALQVAANPGKAYNPLFIYGGVGLGKTHLMHAIGHAMMARDGEVRVAYVHSERFVSDMVRALQHNQINEFKNAYS